MTLVAGSLIKPPQPLRGFSLLELLLVIAVIGLLYTFAGSMLTLTVADPLQEELDRLRQRVELALDESMVRSRPLALGFSSQGYTFFIQDGQGKWEPIKQDSLFKSHQWRGAFQQTLYLQGQAVSLPSQAQARPQVFILPTGEMQPFEWVLQDSNGRSGAVKFDSSGRLQPATDTPS